MFYCFKLPRSRTSWFFANPVFKNPGILIYANINERAQTFPFAWTQVTHNIWNFWSELGGGGGGGGGVNGNLHDLRDNGKPYYTDNARMDKQCLHCNQNI